MASLRESNDSNPAADALSLALQGWLRSVRIETLFVTCLSCKNLSDNGMHCNKFPGYQIPPHIVITGCEAYEDLNPRRIVGMVDGKIITDEDIPF